MRKLFRFFVPIIWVILGLYISGYLIDMLNVRDTLINILGFLGIVLVLYISVVTRLGIYLFKN